MQHKLEGFVMKAIKCPICRGKMRVYHQGNDVGLRAVKTRGERFELRSDPSLRNTPYRISMGCSTGKCVKRIEVRGRSAADAKRKLNSMIQEGRHRFILKAKGIRLFREEEARRKAAKITMESEVSDERQ